MQHNSFRPSSTPSTRKVAMTSKFRRSTAAVAVTALCAAMLPFVAIGPAAAGSVGPEPTALTVSPGSAYAAGGTSATFTGALVGANGSQAQQVFYAITAGPDASPTTPLLGTACAVTGGSFSCTVTAGTQPGVDTVRFFYDAAGTGSYVAPDPSAVASLSIGGVPATAALTPTSARTGAAGYQVFTVLVADAGGRPVVGTQVTVSATENGVSPTDIDVTGSSPALGDTFTGMGTGTGSATTADGTAGTTAGTATFYIASKVPGFLDISSSTAGVQPVRSDATLTVDPAAPQDATTVVISPATQKAFTNGQVQQSISVRNEFGDPIAGATPTVTVTGADVGQTVTVGATDGTGTTTASYDTLGVPGADHVVATVGASPENPSGAADVQVVPEHFDQNAISSSGTVTVPTEVVSAPVTFTLTTNDGSSPAGYALNFAVAGGNYSLDAASAVTDAHGQVTVEVTDPSPSDNDTATVTATLVGDGQVAQSAAVVWVNRAAIDPIIAPFGGTAPTDGTSVHTVSITDAFGTPVPGVTFRWTVQGRNTLGGTDADTGTSFSYTDTGRSNVGGQDTLSVTALNASGGVIGTDAVVQNWVTGNAQAAQVNIDAQPFNGTYLQNVTNGPWVPTNFSKTVTTAVSSDPTTANPVTTPQQIAVKLVDANGDPLYGKVVTFSSSGAGGFTTADGKPIGTSTTAVVADGSGANGEQSPLPTAPPTSNPTFQGWATVFVRSSAIGTERITATVDGISDSATVTYTGQYVPVTPERVLDSRNGQGGLYSDGGAPMSGMLAPNTTYDFYYGNTDMPLGAAAYAFNVTAIHPTGPGYLRLSSVCNSDQAAPTTSLINYQPGKDIANFVIISAGCGDLKIYSSTSSAAVAIDMVGYYPSQESQNIQTQTEVRIADTRTGLDGGTGPILAGTVRSFQVAGTGGVPVGATAAALNLTAISPSGGGHLRVYPDGASLPNASVINYIPGVTKAAFVVVNLPPDGKIDVYSGDATVNLAIDAFAYYPTTSTLVTAAPVRILDTRRGGTLAANTEKTIQVSGLAGVPADAQAVLMTVTSIHTPTSTGGGSLRIYPAGQSRPYVSTLNYVSPTSDVANFTIVKLGTNGQVTLYTAGSSIDVAIDVVGYVPAGGPTVPVGCGSVPQGLRTTPALARLNC